MLTLPKGKVNENYFEECMKSSKPIAPIPSGSIEQMFHDKGPPESTVAHQVLATSLKNNYQNVLDELMYVYITCWPNFEYFSFCVNFCYDKELSIVWLLDKIYISC